MGKVSEAQIKELLASKYLMGVEDDNGCRVNIPIEDLIEIIKENFKSNVDLFYNGIANIRRLSSGDNSIVEKSGFWIATDKGTYIDYGGVVNNSDLSIISVDENGVFHIKTVVHSFEGFISESFENAKDILIATIYDSIDTLNSDLNEYKANLNNDFNTLKTDIEEDVSEMRVEIQQMVESDFKGTISPTDPAPIVEGSYKPTIASEDGIDVNPNDYGTSYPNINNLKAKKGYSTFFVLKNGVWSKSEVEMPSNAIASTVDFLNKVEDKGVSPKQFFDIIGNYQVAVSTGEIKQSQPFAGWNISNGNEQLPTNSFWTYNDNLYTSLEKISGADVKFAQGNWNIFVYAKNDLSTPSKTIVITAEAIGVKRILFDPPINPNTHKVFFTSGVFFKGEPDATGAQNILNNALNNQPGVALAVEFFEIKSILVNSKTIIERLETLEQQDLEVNAFSNSLYNKKGLNIDSLTADSGAFTINTHGLQINSGGVVLEKQTNLSERYLELKVKLKTDTILYVGTKNVENNVGENMAVLNCSIKKLTVGYSNIIVSEENIPFDIVNDREYLIRYYKLNNIQRLELIDTVTCNSVYVEDATTLGQFDKYKFGLTSGSIGIISEISIVSLLKDKPYIGFYGDSITEGNSVGSTLKTPFYRDRFANLIGEKLGKPYFVSGRSAGNIVGVLARMQTELPTLRPNYVMVTIGTNGGNTEANLKQLVDYCEGLGIKVILNLIPLYDGSTAEKNVIIQNVVNSRKLLSVKTNVATSLNGDGVTKDNTKFANESGVLIHPNEAGNLAIYKRALIDVKEIFVESGIF